MAITAAELQLVMTARDNMTREIRRASFELNTLGKAATSAGSMLLRGFGAFVGYQVFQRGLQMLKQGIGDVIAEASEAQRVTAQLNNVIRSTGGAAGVSAKQAQAWASELQKMTRYDDEAIIGAENLLLTFTKIKSDVFPDALKIVLDMSEALGQDLKSSSFQVGKALQDPVLGMTALRRVGVNFTKDQAEMVKQLVESGRGLEAQRFILKELQTEFGGAATAAGGTFGGQVAQLRNRIGELREAIGTELIGVMGRFMDVFSGDAFSVIGNAGKVVIDQIHTLREVPAFIKNLLKDINDASSSVDDFKTTLDLGDVNFGAVVIEMTRQLALFTVEGRYTAENTIIIFNGMKSSLTAFLDHMRAVVQAAKELWANFITVLQGVAMAVDGVASSDYSKVAAGAAIATGAWVSGSLEANKVIDGTAAAIAAANEEWGRTKQQLDAVEVEYDNVRNAIEKVNNTAQSRADIEKAMLAARGDDPRVRRWVEGDEEILDSTSRVTGEVADDWAAAGEKSGTSFLDAIKSAIDKAKSRAEGILFSASSVTAEDQYVSMIGGYSDKTDEYVRRLRSAANDANSAWKHMIPTDVLAMGDTAVKGWVEQQERMFYSGMLPEEVNWEGFIQQYKDQLAAEASKENLVATAMGKLAESGILVSETDVKKALGVDTGSVMADELFNQFGAAIQGKTFGAGIMQRLQQDISDRKADLEVSGGVLWDTMLGGGLAKISPTVASNLIDTVVNIVMGRLNVLPAGGVPPTEY